MGQKMPAVQINIKDVSEKPQWYVVVTKFNYEKKFAGDLQLGLKNSGLDQNIKEIVVPLKETQVTSLTKTGKTRKTTKVEKIYPSYVFVKAIMNETVWNYIRATAGCATILATGADLVIMSERDIDQIKELCGIIKDDKEEKKVLVAEFKGNIGDNVKVIDGIFFDYHGKINKIDRNKDTVDIKLEDSIYTVEINIKDIKIV